nr:hypothetical protein [Kofleriaceae bacterium]
MIISCSGDDGGGSGPQGSAVTGAQDMHCTGVPAQPVDTAACQGHPDGGVPDAGSDDQSDFGATMFNTAGDDDDCKYHVEWSSTPLREGDNVFFTVTATYLGDGTAGSAGQPATGANIFAEVFQGDTHAAPPTNQAATEDPPGTYKVGPIQFDDTGSAGAVGSDGTPAGNPWTVRFHLHEDCIDLLDDSPHGHAAFYLDVP